MVHDETAPAPLVADRTGYSGDAPWAMQLIVRVEKTALPFHTAVCAAAAKAVVSLLDDERAVCGVWAANVDHWAQGHIRKHARRARGARWSAVQNLPGVTVEYAGAQVRALVPCATDVLWPEVARLQLHGLELEDLGVAAGPVEGLTVAITPSPKLSTGKAAAAAGHAAQVARSKMDDATRAAWSAAGYPISVIHPDVGLWDAMCQSAPVRIVDAGFTDVEPGTTTAVATW